MRTVLVRAIAATVALFTLGGCLGGYSPSMRVQEAAQDMNMAARFGRMDIALENVGKDARAAFAKRHADWGRSIRIVDYEFQGLMLKDKEHAEVFLAVAWQRLNESDMRNTVLAQEWVDHKGSWQLEREDRTSGDVGLFGENTVVVHPERSDAQFQTVTIR
jgi:hypothetical protein